MMGRDFGERRWVGWAGEAFSVLIRGIGMLSVGFGRGDGCRGFVYLALYWEGYWIGTAFTQHQCRSCRADDIGDSNAGSPRPDHLPPYPVARGSDFLPQIHQFIIPTQ